MLAGRLAGQDPVSQPVPADKGSLSGSREFQSQEAPVAAVPDPAALVTNPRPGREDDMLHVPVIAMLPAVGGSVKITLRTASAKDP